MEESLHVQISTDKTKAWLSSGGFSAAYNISPSISIGDICKMFEKDKKDFGPGSDYKLEPVYNDNNEFCYNQIAMNIGGENA